ncbi:glutamine--fructose-6-phosphate transaminase (isomerizing) [Thermoflexus sp.]|uniref:glutamine--fructose-6-phosphate transaminase (isomerizing) n=1 Tax=Thermoflexus sp. TaxID=1969742 RepID=UPI0025F66446|nr:glutamine--fructose-6-phosphate transaminase (isomerizing) [Thermoflexus sp.]MDW8181735.1 glutamine--fructose-6-phosphate transaminase (isomerizing) [Anaerolineae bacterium]MCS6965069.1 glutamine--fructose-6-phosphate transaminase (isomerizing) [Thermoflexus sp.]MCS7352272.1 glutamine--fructose-6-phosphate transaminase (isomerizing) [Thermoflexus sp.]MCX7689391.1 glutamine--fructose-6-phosphate transaminase (isomerizing) [Thermoflexus sp.]MDW8186114.1 glutamine--fructose-6-phosphate transam
MCGIVGYVGGQDAVPILVDGLRRLEYRGYDSAGLVVIQQGRLEIRRRVGKIRQLMDLLEAEPASGPIGMGHTRWATHGAPADHNAHPHRDCTGRIAVIHNGIVENFAELRQELESRGHRFTSETDTEVIAHLIEEHLRGGADLETAARRAFQALRGAHAIVALSADHPDRLLAARIGNAGGVVIGLGEGETFVASDIPAILEHTRRVLFLENRQMAVVRRDAVQVMTLDGHPVTLPVHVIPWDPVAAERGPYRHFMHKEIHEQPRAVTDTLRGRVDFERGRVLLEEIPLTAPEARQIERLVIVACGTSYYAGLVGKFYFESLARIPTEVDYGSEFRYRDPVLGKGTVVLAISQSGETVDTLAAMELARERGARLWSIVNAIGSQAHRIADACLLMHAGPEIGVASSKAFTASLVDQLLLSLRLAELRGTMGPEAIREHVRALARLPDLLGQVLDREEAVKRVAQAFYRHENFLYLGRGPLYPIALEGALKLKELSYIHAEGYPAGEMKHGPIALIDERMPTVALALQDPVTYEKMLSQMEQVRARRGQVIALITEGDRTAAARADVVLEAPAVPRWLAPIVAVIPLQLLAYHMAVLRGCDVDQPRNLAKSVTVE